MRPDCLFAAAGMVAAMSVTATSAADTSLTPGLYRIEVRISLPNVQDVAAPLMMTRCLNGEDLQTGQAFFILSDNPLKTCELVDFQPSAATALYRVACAGPNRGSAVAVFDTRVDSYRGTIRMNMGGKNMTMSETQVGKRIGDCE